MGEHGGELKMKVFPLPPAVNFFGPPILLSSSSSSSPLSFKETATFRVLLIQRGFMTEEEEGEERPAVAFSFSPEHGHALRRREKEEQ